MHAIFKSMEPILEPCRRKSANNLAASASDGRISHSENASICRWNFEYGAIWRSRSLWRLICASQPRVSSSTVTMVSAFSSRLAVKREASCRPGVKFRSSSEKWSVSRTSNFFPVSLPFAIFAPKPDGSLEIRVVLEDSYRSAPIFFSLRLSDSRGQLSHSFFQRFHPLFYRLRHAGKIARGCLSFHKEILGPYRAVRLLDESTV